VGVATVVGTDVVAGAVVEGGVEVVVGAAVVDDGGVVVIAVVGDAAMDVVVGDRASSVGEPLPHAEASVANTTAMTKQVERVMALTQLSLESTPGDRPANETADIGERRVGNIDHLVAGLNLRELASRQ